MHPPWILIGIRAKRNGRKIDVGGSDYYLAFSKLFFKLKIVAVFLIRIFVRK